VPSLKYKTLLGALLISFVTLPALAIAQEEPCDLIIAKAGEAPLAEPTLPLSLEAWQGFDARELSDHDKILFAKVGDYLNNGDVRIALELLQLGLPKEQLIKMMSPRVAAELTVLESEGPPLRLFHDPLREDAAALISRQAFTIDGFAQAYGLMPHIETAAALAGYRIFARDRIVPDNVLKVAILTENRDLIQRSFQQAVKFGHFDQVTAIAAEMKSDSLLMELGELSVTRYLYSERNINWLAQGLRSFSELTQPESQARAQALLYDLYDLMRSQEIFANEYRVNMEQSARAKVAYYDDAAMRVLVATRPVTRRLRGDSSSAFSYLHERTRDPQFVNRVLAHFDDVVATNRHLYHVQRGVILIDDPEVLLQIARKAEAHSYEVANVPGTDPRQASGAMRLAAAALIMSANLEEIGHYVRRMVEDSRFDVTRKPYGPALGDDILGTPPEVVGLFRAYLRDPSLVSPQANSENLQQLAEWVDTYDYRMAQNPEGSVGPASKTFYIPAFTHERKDFLSFLKNGEGAGPEALAKLRDAGEGALARDAFWEAMKNFIAARDVDGLERTYLATLERGRPVDASYMAFALLWLRAGVQETFETLNTVNGIQNSESPDP